MRYMLAAFGMLLLVTVSLAQQQGQGLPNSPPYGTPPTFPGGSPQQPSQMPPDQKAPPPRTMSTNEVEQQIQEHLNSEPALSEIRLDVIADEASVALSGTVDSEKQHSLALRIARSYAGERKIIDTIAIITEQRNRTIVVTSHFTQNPARRDFECYGLVTTVTLHYDFPRSIITQ